MNLFVPNIMQIHPIVVHWIIENFEQERQHEFQVKPDSLEVQFKPSLVLEKLIANQFIQGKAKSRTCFRGFEASG